MNKIFLVLYKDLFDLVFDVELEYTDWWSFSDLFDVVNTFQNNLQESETHTGSTSVYFLQNYYCMHLL